MTQIDSGSGTQIPGVAKHAVVRPALDSDDSGAPPGCVNQWPQPGFNQGNGTTERTFFASQTLTCDVTEIEVSYNPGTPGGVPTGGGIVDVYDWWSFSGYSNKVTENLFITVFGLFGATPGVLLVHGDLLCPTQGFCSSSSDSFTTQPLGPGAMWRKTFTETIALGASQQVTADPNGGTKAAGADLIVSFPGTEHVAHVPTKPSLVWRCDTIALPSVGCVTPPNSGIRPPTMLFTDADYPDMDPVIRHIKWSQDNVRTSSGYRYGIDIPLHRETNQTQINNNFRDAGCDVASKMPSQRDGLFTSCDEFPFKSTQEGGTGATILPVSPMANSHQGGIIGPFYNQYRRLQSDPFFVKAEADNADVPPNTTASPEPDPWSKQRIAVFGDSISAAREGDFSWRYRLYEGLYAGGQAPHFYGKFKMANGSGTYRVNPYGLAATAPLGLTAWPKPYTDCIFSCDHSAVWGKMMYQEEGDVEGIVSAAQAGTVLIEMGTNDVYVGKASVQTMENLVDQFVAHIRNVNPYATIIIGNVYHRTTLADWPGLDERTDNWDNALATDVSTRWNTAASRVAVADERAGFDPYTDTYDGIHPNIVGEYKIARAFNGALNSVGQGNSSWPSFVAPPDLKPAPPSNLTCTANDYGVTLNFTPSYGASQLFRMVDITNGDVALPTSGGGHRQGAVQRQFPRQRRTLQIRSLRFAGQ